MKYKLLIVTVTYKPNVEELSQCIDSIIRMNDIGDEMKLVIVDNSPTENSIIKIFSEKYPMVYFLAAPENKGFGYSNNLGIKEFDSDFILVFNNDTELVEPVFRKIIKDFAKNSKLGCVGIKQAYGNPSFFKRHESSIGYFQMKWRIKNEQYDNKNFFIPGAFMFMSRKAFVDAGMFDENIFMYSEEIDLSNRMLMAGYDIQYRNDISFWHKTGLRHTFPLSTYEVQFKSYLYYMNKYGYDNMVLKNIREIIAMMILKSICFCIIGKTETSKKLIDATRFHIRKYKELKKETIYNTKTV